MTDKWRKQDAADAAPRIEPWLLFGIAMIVAVASLFFGVGTWIIRGHQTDRAVERADAATDALTEGRDESERLVAKNDRLLQELAGARDGSTRFEQELRRSAQRVEALNAERKRTEQLMADTRLVDAEPSRLPESALIETLDLEKDVVSFVSLDKEAQRSGLTVGAIVSFLKQEAGRECGLRFNETGESRLSVAVATISSAGGRVAMSVSLEVEQIWKVPGNDGHRRVVIWRRHTVGLTTQDKAPSVIEEIVGGLVEELADDLHG